MKKHYYLYAIVVIALVSIIPSITKAEDSTGNSGKTNPPSTVAPTQRPGLPVPTLIREQIRTKSDNIKNNEEIRNKMLDNAKLGSTTPPRPGTLGDIRGLASTTRAERKEVANDRRDEVKDIRQQGREDIKNASSSIERREIRKDMRKDEFKARKDAVIKQLNITLANLKQIRERISSRINKSSSEGRDMTKAKGLLAIADGKIILAEQAINAVIALNPTASSTSTASSTIDLNKPREIGNVAIKALKNAHESLVAVVVAIAHSMGLGNATSTPPVIPVATTTASTTTTI